MRIFGLGIPELFLLILVFSIVFFVRAMIKKEGGEGEPPEPSADDTFVEKASTTKLGFDRVMSQVEVNSDTKDLFYKDYREARLTGDTREEEKAAITHLSNSGWKWNEYDKWFKIFKEKGVWPYMWNTVLYEEEAQKLPGTLEEATDFLNVAEMRSLLKNKNIKAKPAPRKRVEFKETIGQFLSLNDLIPIVEKKINNYNSSLIQEREEQKCKLLVHTLSMSVYSQRDYRRCMEFIQSDPVRYELTAEESDGVCPIENEFTHKFNSGEVDTIPPFFPGDRTGILCEDKEYP